MKILILPGDDIGPEINAQTCRVLEQLNSGLGLGLACESLDIGFASLEITGSTLSDEVIERCGQVDGTILGPVGSFKYPKESEGGRSASKYIRLAYDLYANIRPSRTRPGVTAMAADMDLVIVRENTEGFYADRNMFAGNGEFMPTDDMVLSVRKITRRGCRRIARTAFELASRRRKHLTVVHKGNVLKMGDGFYLEQVRDVGRDYPDVATDEVIVDAMTAHLIRRPAEFDVVVCTNMMGDILSDEAAELSGGLGLGPSINHSDEHCIAQAAHGSAPDIAGQGVANPAAHMESAAMLLDWLAAKHGRDDLADAAKRWTAAIDAALADPVNHTPDLGGSGTTRGVGDAVLKALEA